MSAEHRNYELYLIFAENGEKGLEKYLALLEKLGGKVDHKISYGIKELAYKIKQHHKGYCEVLQISGLPEIIKTLEIELARDEKVLRFMTSLLDKHAIAYNEAKRSSIKESETPAFVEEIIEETVEN